MLLAHWLYILAGLISIYPPAKHAANEMIAEKLDELEEAARRGEVPVLAMARSAKRYSQGGGVPEGGGGGARMKHVITSGRRC